MQTYNLFSFLLGVRSDSGDAAVDFVNLPGKALVGGVLRGEFAETKLSAEPGKIPYHCAVLNLTKLAKVSAKALGVCDRLQTANEHLHVTDRTTTFVPYM
jgi:hypothetical protein